MKTEFKIKENNYRIKKMNAIELLALQTQVDYSNMSLAMNCYKIFLERIEVQVKDKWMPVKTEGQEVYFPLDVEEDIEVVQELIKNMVKYLREVFQKSNELSE